MPLYELLTSRRDEVMSRWKEQVQGTVAPDSIPAVELIDHLPEFLIEIAEALRGRGSCDAGKQSTDEGAIAATHGKQRLRLGFSVESVVREYGALRAAIVETAREAGAPPTLDEMQIVFDCLVTGIAYAVSEYALQRDAELTRQANEHFAFIAHELRNPLSAATMAFQLLRTGGHLPAASRSVRALERGLQRTHELIDQTLEAARVASGIELRRQSTTLTTLFDDVEMGAISEAEAKGVEIRVAVKNDERVDLDLRLVRSATSNLLQNGIKYTEAGGIVELRGSITNHRVVVEVEDCCGGLEPEEAEEAFVPFVRLDKSQSGFGLGLAIAKQAVEAHGGSIRVQNLPGKGCVFVLEIPFERQNESIVGLR
jgi:signal transduction histidine kinase